MISKTKVNKRLKQKTNPDLVKTMLLSKNKGLSKIAAAVSVPTRQQAKVNLEELNKIKHEKIIVPGKVLGSGDIKRKIKVYALGFSEEAKKKLKLAGCEFKTILEALENGLDLNGELIR